MKKATNGLIVDFRGTPQAVQDIAAVAPELAAVAKVKVTSNQGGELVAAPGFTYEQLEQALQEALHKRWPERY